MSNLELAPSPEAPTSLSTQELLLRHDPDPLGYISQAVYLIANHASEKDNVEHGYMEIARFASHKYDRPLMESTLQHIPEPGDRWQLLAEEVRDRRTCISTAAIVQWGEELAELEAAPEAEKDYGRLSAVYAAKVAIDTYTDEFNVSNQQNLYEALQKVQSADLRNQDFTRWRIANEACNNVVFSLLERGQFDEAERFKSFLPSYDLENYAALKPLYQAWAKGGPDPETDPQSRDLLLQHAPGQYIAHSYGEVVVGYSHSLTHKWDARPAWALRMALHTKPEDYKEALAAMAGLRKIVSQVDSNPGLPAPELREQLLKTCDHIDHLPISTQRMALGLEAAEIRNTLLPQDMPAKKHCDTTLLRPWHTINATQGGQFSPGRRAPQAKAVSQLRKDLKEVAGYTDFQLDDLGMIGRFLWHHGSLR